MYSWKDGNGEPRMLCFAVVFLVFWGTLPPFRSRMGPGPENLNPVRTPGCRFRCFSWKIASRNHQYSLGLIGILSAATTEFWSSKSTKYDNEYVGIFGISRGCQETCSKRTNKRQRRAAFELPVPGNRWNHHANDWKSIRGVAKTHVLHFRESSKIPTYLLCYFDDLETRFPEFHDFHPKCYILCFKR